MAPVVTVHANKKTMKRTISDTDLQNAYIQAATIVAKYGDIYLPVFKRLESEFNKRKEETDAMNRALEIAFSSHNPD